MSFIQESRVEKVNILASLSNMNCSPKVARFYSSSWRILKSVTNDGTKTKSHPILLLVCHVSFHKVEHPIRGISLNRHLPIIVKGLGDCENVKTKYAFRPQQYVSNTQGVG